MKVYTETDVSYETFAFTLYIHVCVQHSVGAAIDSYPTSMSLADSAIAGISTTACTVVTRLRLPGERLL